jgi:catechol 2,3-dioxygenase-like lactoylglutathione lyase family enzyme
MLERLAFVMLAVRDVERAATFYRDTLGLPMTRRFEAFAFFDTGEAKLALTSELGSDNGDSQGHECVFAVTSVTQAYAALRNRIEFLNEPRPVSDVNWAVNFRDPEGHLLSLYGPQ